MLSKNEKARAALIENFPLYAETALKIKTKGDGVQPFILNRAQKYIHEKVEGQLHVLGYVRVLILKGRQQGCSTYVAGRFYWKVSQNKGKNARVIAHDTDTTKMLFTMTRTYHDKCPEILRPTTRAASSREFDFDGLDSGYMVSTAGSKEGGRGGTLQYLHGSEVAFWANPEGIIRGVMESIPSGTDIGGSEIFLESTANGPGGKFYEMWMSATDPIEANRGEYIAIFTPWWWNDEYRSVINDIDELELTRDEQGYKDRNGLDNAQILWRRRKINGGLKLDGFKQEYPETPEEAFEYSVIGAWFDGDFVSEAMIDKEFKTQIGAVVGALDPGGEKEGADRTAIGHGDDIAIDNVECWEPMKPKPMARRAEQYIEDNKLQLLRVDTVGIGVAVYNELKDGRFKHLIESYQGSGATSTYLDGVPVYANKRAESYGRLAEWIGDGSLIQIPNNIDLKKDIMGPRQTTHKTNFRIVAESKEDMKNRGIPSPDMLDVLAMIKAEKVRKDLTKRDEYDTVLDTDYDVLNYGLD